MEIDPITLCLDCFPPVGRGGKRERESKRGKWTGEAEREDEETERERGSGNRNVGATGKKKRKWRREMEREEIEGGDGEEKMEKVAKKRQGDTVYVIRGDRMAVGVVSCLDWQAGWLCISVVLIADRHWARWKKREEKAEDKVEGAEERHALKGWYTSCWGFQPTDLWCLGMRSCCETELATVMGCGSAQYQAGALKY